MPVPMATDSPLDAMKAILSRRSRLYVCDAWVVARPTSGAEVTAALQMIRRHSIGPDQSHKMNSGSLTVRN